MAGRRWFSIRLFEALLLPPRIPADGDDAASTTAIMVVGTIAFMEPTAAPLPMMRAAAAAAADVAVFPLLFFIFITVVLVDEQYLGNLLNTTYKQPTTDLPQRPG